MKLYTVYSNCLKQKYGDKVYKLPINIPVLCPNRINSYGCSFCSEIGTGFESLSNTLSVTQQLRENMDYISSRYKANKFIAYFQNYTNTFLPYEKFKEYIKEASEVENIVEISISTRPDCISDKYLEFLAEIQNNKNINITIELGLQTTNYHTLEKINRGHTLAEFIDAVLRISKYKFDICVHVILNLPWDNMLDTIESSKIISILPITDVKIHSLYIAKGTVLEKQYINGEFEICSKEEYVERVVTFLEYLRPDIAVQRLVSRAPEEDTVFCNWNTSWWKIRDDIENEMKNNDRYQGIKYNYTNGPSLKMRCIDIGEESC